MTFVLETAVADTDQLFGYRQRLFAIVWTCWAKLCVIDTGNQWFGKKKKLSGTFFNMFIKVYNCLSIYLPVHWDLEVVG